MTTITSLEQLDALYGNVPKRRCGEVASVEIGAAFLLKERLNAQATGNRRPDQAAAVLRASFDQALPSLAALHTPDEDRWFFRERMFVDCQIWGYFNDQELVGISAFREGWIDQLYILPTWQGHRIGTALLQVAKDRSVRLSLWTFQRNKRARSFYEKHGFVAISETDGSRNEEKEPDVMYLWEREHFEPGGPHSALSTLGLAANDFRS